MNDSNVRPTVNEIIDGPVASIDRVYAVDRVRDLCRAAPRAVRRRFFQAEIVCLLCGREAGTASADHWPPTGPILFQTPGAPRAT